LIEIKVSDLEADQRLDRYLRREFEDISMGQIFKMIRKKKIRVNGVRAKPEEHVGPGDTIEIYENIESMAHEKKVEAQKFAAKDNWGGLISLRKSSEIDITYEDDDVIIINKKAGIAVHPGSGQADGQTLIEQIWKIMAISDDQRFKPQLVHRLDKGTSGLIVVALRGGSLKIWSALFRDRNIIKKYVALVKGHVEENKGEIKLQLERSDSKSGGAKIKVTSGGGQFSLTRYKVLKRYSPKNTDEACTLVEVDLGTGRMHQIRTHFEHLGHPLLGDDRYGNFETNRHFKKLFGLKRMFLHSAKLSWGEAKTHADIPIELQDVLDKMADYSKKK
tara:strand:- start:1253 stop:2251 length:999 start_codon:yes stop_codon:yes gene_type:complete